MNRLLAIAAIGEAATGLVALAYPPLVVRLLFGAEIDGIGTVVCRIAGISLIALGLACWSGRDTGRSLVWPAGAMLTYGLLATLYLAFLGVGGRWLGPLLWPAVVVHALLTLLLARAWIDMRKQVR